MTLTTKEQIEGFLACMFPVTEPNAGRVINELESCRSDWPLLANDLGKCNVFAQVYLSLSEAYFKQQNYKRAVETLEEGIVEYSKVCEYSYSVKKDMYHNLGIYQSYLGDETAALKSFRKFVFYLTINNRTYKDIPLYCYKKISDYTIKDLKNSQITLSDPDEFDDPVDCLVFPWMEKNSADAMTDGDKVAARLINEAFSYVRIKCFVRNAPLPTVKDPRPSSNDKAEYSNVIMWPTYADYHKGICMEYHLPTEVQSPYIDEEKTFFLQDVDYTETVTLGDTISIREAFFTKSIEWAFEKETRLLYYDTKGTEKFKSVDVPKESLKKVFFGIRCSDDDMFKVIKALENNMTVEFYVMRLSPNDIYTFKPVKIDGAKFVASYENEHTKNKGCLCSFVSGVVEKIGNLCK